MSDNVIIKIIKELSVVWIPVWILGAVLGYMYFEWIVVRAEPSSLCTKDMCYNEKPYTCKKGRCYDSDTRELQPAVEEGV